MCLGSHYDGVIKRVPSKVERMLPVTGKSFSESLILASTKPQYDKRLFMELPWKLQAQNMGRTCSVLCKYFSW